MINFQSVAFQVERFYGKLSHTAEKRLTTLGNIVLRRYENTNLTF